MELVKKLSKILDAMNLRTFNLKPRSPIFWAVCVAVAFLLHFLKLIYVKRKRIYNQDSRTPGQAVRSFYVGYDFKSLSEESEPSVEKRSSTCYSRLGCFTTGAPFYSLQRPINLLPQSPDTIQTKYLLYTRESRKQESVLDARYPGQFSSLWPNYKASRPTKIIVHGFVDSTYLNPWMREMKDELLTHGDYNVIITDWHHGNLPPYTQATGNTRVVGAQLADLISVITQATTQTPSDFHIMGHSLGAHIAGYAGMRLDGLGRITGMDPAGPYFEDTDPEVRLDPTDATFVDNIHSDAAPLLTLGFGLKQPLGHADFYPNLGRDQPGCDQSVVGQVSDNGVFQGTQEYVACNHLRSWHFMLESINSQCPFTAIPCDKAEDFEAGRCSSCTDAGCSRMGFHADVNIPATPTKYFLSTADHAPFCQYHVSVVVHLGTQQTSELGTLSMRLMGDKGSSGWVNVQEESKNFDPSTSHPYTFGVPSDPGHVTSVEVKWSHVASISDPLHWNPFGLRHPTMKLNGVDVTVVETGSKSRFCTAHGTVETDQSLTLNKQCDA